MNQRAAIAYTLNKAMFWANAPDTNRKVEFKQERVWNGDDVKTTIYVFDANAMISGHLPLPFKGNIDKFLCEKNQEQLVSSIENLQESLDKAVKKCSEMED